MSDVWPVWAWVLVPEGHGLHSVASIPELYVFTGQSSQALALFTFKYDPLGQTGKKHYEFIKKPFQYRLHTEKKIAFLWPMFVPKGYERG